MKKLLLISLVCVFVMSFVITGLAKIELVYWGFPAFEQEGKGVGWYDKERARAFEAIYPEVEISVEILPWDGGKERLSMAVASGAAPDILNSYQMLAMQYAVAGKLVDFEDMLTPEVRDDFDALILIPCSYKGKVYFWPIGICAGGMAINMNIVREAGAEDLLPLDRENRDWTIDEFKAFCQKIADAKLPDVWATFYFFGDSDSQQHQVFRFHQAFGAPDPLVVGVDGKWKCQINSPESVEGLEWYMELLEHPGFVLPGPENIGVSGIDDWYWTGHIACYGAGGYGMIMNEKAMPSLPTETVLVTFPTKEKGMQLKNDIGLDGFCIFDNNQDAKTLEYAKMFVDFWPKSDYLELATRMASVRKSLPKEYPVDADPEFIYASEKLTKFVGDKGSMCPVFMEYRVIYAATMQGVAIGELTAKEGLDIVAEKVNKLLDEYYEEN